MPVVRRRVPAPLTYPRVVVDASVWVSILMSHDANHLDSLTWWRIYTGSGGVIVAPELLLVEVSAAIARQTKQLSLAAQAVDYLQQASQVEFVAVDTSLVLEAAKLAARLSIKGADAIYVATAYQQSLPLVSWDQEQLNRATLLIHKFTPITFTH